MWIFVSFLFTCQIPNSDKNKSPTGNIQKMKCYFFFIPDCPACKSNFNKLLLLRDKYESRGLDIIAVYSDPMPDSVALEDMRSKYNFNIRIENDFNLVIARKYQATVTPQFVLIDSNDQVAYSGMLDNYYSSLGKHRNRVTRTYLEDAILALLDDKEPAIKYTEPIGCKINYDLTEVQAANP